MHFTKDRTAIHPTASYAFLEHLACIVTPIAVLVFTRKRPSVAEGASSVLCLVGCFILSGLGSAGGIAFGIGDLLCATSGILLGICVAAIGSYTKKLDISLFMLIHTTTYFALSLITTFALNGLHIHGMPMEAIRMSRSLPLLLGVVMLGITDIALCWLLRTEAIHHIGPSTIVILSPFSAVITSIVSICLGLDRLTPNLVIGGLLILVAVTLPETVLTLQHHLKRK